MMDQQQFYQQRNLQSPQPYQQFYYNNASGQQNPQMMNNGMGMPMQSPSPHQAMPNMPTQ
jgi:hypothetical protein